MGCSNSKQTVSVRPAVDHSGAVRGNAVDVDTVTGSGRFGSGLEVESEKKARKKRGESGLSWGDLGESGRASSIGGCCDSVSFRLVHLHRYVEGEHVAAGWPSWLSAVAGEAIHGLVPLPPESFQKLEKIGQGTYSSVFRARDLETRKIVALKKVRFDSFDPESVRFMAREITILRRLDHPNIIKLEGLIASQMSCSIYLVFEYMEHDLTGLLACPQIMFSDSQIKCYMKQLLCGLEHCHTRGVMHRDIKGSNILINNEGILKVADFGLANFCCYNKRKQPLTSRVVTLWYRPPELLLGATDYGASVDLWSVGCVFAEVFLGKPILQGRTEVEQLHRIFKLCGSPPNEYWKKSKLPHATLFKPHQPYESCLRDTCNGVPPKAVNLIETFLSIEPQKRRTASAALASEYFTTEPYPCEPSTLPVYPPNKEIDANGRDEALRKKVAGRRVHGLETRKLTRKYTGMRKLAPAEDLPPKRQGLHKINKNGLKERDVMFCEESRKDSVEEASHVKNASHGDIPYSGPLQVPGSSGFAWVKKQIDGACIKSHRRSSSRGVYNGLEGLVAMNERDYLDSKRHENIDVLNGFRVESRGCDSYEMAKNAMPKQWGHLDRPGLFEASDGYHSQELTLALYQREEMAARRNNLDYQDQGDKIEFSGPLLSVT